MEKRLVAKALFMIVVIIVSIFTISNFKVVSAEENNLCCEQTTGGDNCVYTTASSCDNDYLTAATSCEQTSFCEPGCCVSEEGRCSKSVGRSTCESLDGYSWYDGAACEIDACQEECCVIGEAQCFLSTEAYCKNTVSGFEDLELDWRDVDSENECVNICEASTKGCCVSEDSCTYGAKGLCEYDGVDLTNGVGFYDETYCSDVGICGCVNSGDDIRCINEDAYYFDSCGNQDTLADNCDYAKGTWCGTDSEGNVGCQDTGCSDTFDGIYYINDYAVNRNPHDSKIGDSRENGESWCLYESPAGDFKDRPGSQHYRSICYFGEEIIEPCEDYRQEICIQYPYGDYDGVSGSACIDNDNELFNPMITTVSVGNNWDDSSLVDTCAAANFECPVLYAVSSYTDATWEAARNLNCLSPNWVLDASSYCASMGDCGANANLVEEFTDSSFSMIKSQDWIGGDLAPNVTDEAYTRHKTVIGYDTCIESSNVDPDSETGEIYCKTSEMNCQIKNSEDADGVGGCEFIDSVEEVYSGTNGIYSNLDYSWKYNYGVYSGLLGVSETIGENIDSQVDPSLGVPVASYIINFGSALGYVIGWEAAGWYLAEEGSSKLALMFGNGLAEVGVSFLDFIPVIGAAITLIIQYSNILSEDDPLMELEKSKQSAMTNYIGAGLSAVLYIAPSLIQGGAAFGPWGLLVAAVILAVAAVLQGGGETKEIIITSQCGPWTPPQGGDDCTLCDIPVSEGGLALDIGGNILRGYECTEYKCKSLGMACEYISENQGTDRPKCIASEINDVNHPIIEDAYLFGDYANLDVDFAKDKYLIVNEKVQPYTFFEFGIDTDEASQCKIEEATQENSFTSEDYDSMEMFFPDSYFDYTHNQSWILMPETKYSFYIRCTDINTRAHEAPFVVQVETDAGVDLTPPSIEATSIKNGGYISAGATETALSVFVNEPVQYCKWSSNDVEYSIMENFFLCSGIPPSASPYFENECSTTLSVIEGTNSYYIACEDGAGNANTENYYFSLQSTVPLLIDYVSPNGETIYLENVDMQVKTSEGAESGKAVCYYNGIEFFDTNTSTHIQSLQGLIAGVYNYDISCVDVAGNKNESVISFTIDVDIDEPELVNIYSSESTIYFTLDEDATCEYYFEDFNFGSGTDVSGNSFTLTDVDEYYLKCQDIFGNTGEWIINV